MPYAAPKNFSKPTVVIMTERELMELLQDKDNSIQKLVTRWLNESLIELTEKRIKENER